MKILKTKKEVVKKVDIFKKNKRSKIRPEGFIVGRENIYLTTNNGRMLIIQILNGKIDHGFKTGLKIWKNETQTLEENISFEICKFGPKINILEGSFIFLISGNINFKIIDLIFPIFTFTFVSYIQHITDADE